MSYPTKYPPKEFFILPSDADLDVDLANFRHGEAQNLKDGRMMLAAILVGTDMIKLPKAVFRIPGVNPKIREFIFVRICKHVGGINPSGPNLRLLDNLGATKEEIEGLKSDGLVAGMDEEASLVMRAYGELTLKGRVGDKALRRMNERYDEQTVIKHILVCSWYNMFNRFTVSTRVPVESERDIDEKIGGARSLREVMGLW